ncbi:MAG: hypothetical protein JO199_11000 [Candidatus Eremiobacteraeota bacterium]|nr:hypothetical protein [Candidatus Eremiobacteraeota bacterium]
MTTITVSPNSTATGSFSLNPVAKGLTWVSAEGYPNGTGTPSYNTSTKAYSCSSSCYDPLLNASGTPSEDAVSLNVTDANGDTIIPTWETAAVSGKPNVPIFLNSNGDEQRVNVTCDDSDVEWITSSSPQSVANLVSSTTSTPVGPGYVNTALANGSQTSGFNIWYGPGNYDAVHNANSFNSPYNGADGQGPGFGTSYGGSPIADNIYGNNGAYMNYDGGGNGTAPSWSYVMCVASLGSVTAPYYIGNAEGGINWGTNAHHHHPDRSK